MEDSLPRIYRDVTGEEYPGRRLDDTLSLAPEDMDDLRALCGGDTLHFQLTRELLSITRQQRNSARRVGLNQRIEQALRRHCYDSPEDALQRARKMAADRKTFAERDQQAH